VIQNHLLQIVSYLAMEAPSSTYAEAVRDEQVEVLRRIRPMSERDLVLGQFRAYTSERGVPPDSRVPTFAAMQLFVDSWRWEGVPLFVRAGKCLAASCTEIVVRLKEAPPVVFRDDSQHRSNYVRFRLAPRVTIDIGANAKLPGAGMSGQAVELSVVAGPRQGSGPRLGPYERLIGDAMIGDATLFARQDLVEAAWAIVDPVLTLERQPVLYECGSWGPQEANRLVGDEGWTVAPVESESLA
jgi:glucose-6-phosphate 1-dehydrogenase